VKDHLGSDEGIMDSRDESEGKCQIIKPAKGREKDLSGIEEKDGQDDCHFQDGARFSPDGRRKSIYSPQLVGDEGP